MNPEPISNPSPDPMHDAFPAAAPSDALRLRVATLAVLPVARPRLGRTIALGAGAVVLGGALALSLHGTHGKKAAPASPTVRHTRRYRLEGKGAKRLVQEDWSAPGEARMEGHENGTFTMIASHRGGFSIGWQSDYGDLRLTDVPPPLTAPPAARILDEAGLAALARAAHQSPPTLTDGLLDGKRVKRAEMESSVLYADPETLRLIAFEEETPRGRERTYEDEAPPPPGAFAPEIEYGGRRIDVLAERKRIGDRLAKPLATYRIPEGTVEIRHVAMTRSGDLFVLYTGVNAAYQHNAIPDRIADDAGGVYVRGIGFNPYLGPRPDRWPGFAFGGKPLEGAWYARLGKGRPHKVEIGFRRQWPPGQKEPAFVYRTAIAPAWTDLLDFMPFMSMGFATQTRLNDGRAFARADFYGRKGRWSDMERELRRCVALNDAFFARRGKGNALLHAFLADALARQGKKADARREVAVARARAEASDTHLEEMLRATERRIGP